MTVGVLNDLTRCVGCEACVLACREANGLPLEGDTRTLSARSWSAIDRSHGVPVRRQCMHCLDPACASACPVAALSRSDSGAVVYDEEKCLGCRYCMLACPFGVPTYEWSSLKPRVQKCILCHDRFVSKGEPPACSRVCPTGATIFGQREEIILEAKRRLTEHPERYVPHIYGLEEAGGTSVLYLSSVPFEELGFPAGVRSHAYPELTWAVLGHLPEVVGVSGVTLASLAWIIRRRDRVAIVEGEKSSERERSER